MSGTNANPEKGSDFSLEMVTLMQKLKSAFIRAARMNHYRLTKSFRKG